MGDKENNLPFTQHPDDTLTPTTGGRSRMGELGINAWGLAVQLVAFIVFIVLFWKYALGPITKMLDERSRRISESMAAADEMKSEMARASVRNEEILAEARQQAQQIIGQPREVSEATIGR